MKRLLALSVAVAIASPLAAQNDEAKWPDCYCTDRTGTRIELGQTICMRVDGRSFTARCEMSLNNPMWREVGDGCLSSELPQSKPLTST